MNARRRRPADGAPRVIVVGAGFAGLAAVKALDGTGAQVMLVDRNIYSTFQPLLPLGHVRAVQRERGNRRHEVVRQWRARGHSSSPSGRSVRPPVGLVCSARRSHAYVIHRRPSRAANPVTRQDAVLLAARGQVGPRPSGTAPPPCARPELAVVDR